MKKLLSLLLIVFIGFTLTACSDTTKPVITGVDNVTINVGDSFDPLAGVKATDDKDGNITKNIQVLGTVNPDLAGKYTLRYIVIDKAGNKTQVYRQVEVIVDTTTKVGMVFNGDFSQDRNGWDTLNQDGGSADFTVVNGELEIKINSLSWLGYSPRLSQSGIKFEQGKTYLVSFDARALVARKVHIQTGELLTANPWFTKFDQGGNVITIGTTMETHSFKFTMNEDSNENGAVVFEFGKILADGSNEEVITTVYMDNIKIEESTPDPDTIKPTITGIDDVTIEKGTAFDKKAGVGVTDNQDTTLTVDSITITGDVDVNVPGVYEITYTVSDAKGNIQTKVRKVTVVALLFKDTTEIVNGDFANPINDTTPEWITFIDTNGYSGSVAAATYGIVDGAYEYDITAVGSANWAVQLQQKGIALEKGKTYKLVFDAKAAVARDILVEFGYDSNGAADGGFIGYNNKTISITDTMATYEFMFTVTKDSYNDMQLTFVLGLINNSAAGKVTLDNVKLQELDEQPVITNSTMDSTGWATFIDTQSWSGSAGAATFGIVNGVYEYDVTSVGGAAWAVQFVQENVKLENGKTYKVTFKAKADAARYFEMPIGTEVVSWAEISRLKDINVTTDWQTFTHEFVYSGDTTEIAKIKFELGKYVNNNGTPDDTSDDVVTSANGKIYFDDVKLLVQDATDTAVYNDTNEVVNGTFDQVVNWGSWWGDNGSGVATGSVSPVDGVIVIDTTVIGTAAYAPQVYQDGLTIKGDRKYVIEFDIKADVARAINVQLGQPLSSAPWFNEFMTGEKVSVTTEWKHITLTFDMTQVTNINGKLVFELGTIDGATGVNKIYIDNVVIYPDFN